MARYTCSITVAVALENLYQNITEILKSCGLEVLIFREDYVMAREKPGQFPFAKLATVEVLVDSTRSTMHAADFELVVKNEELPLQSNNHCCQVYQQILQKSDANESWRLLSCSDQNFSIRSGTSSAPPSGPSVAAASPATATSSAAPRAVPPSAATPSQPVAVPQAQAVVSPPSASSGTPISSPIFPQGSPPLTPKVPQPSVSQDSELTNPNSIPIASPAPTSRPVSQPSAAAPPQSAVPTAPPRPTSSDPSRFTSLPEIKPRASQSELNAIPTRRSNGAIPETSPSTQNGSKLTWQPLTSPTTPPDQSQQGAPKASEEEEADSNRTNGQSQRNGNSPIQPMIIRQDSQSK